MSKAPSKTSSGTVADQVAEFIGRTMGELLNRKDALTKQMADVDHQIAEIRQRVVRQFGTYLPAPERARRPAGRKRPAAASTRAVSAATRRKMAEAARRRWARERAKKAKADKGPAK